MEFWANWANLGKFEIWAKLLPKIGKIWPKFWANLETFWAICAICPKEIKKSRFFNLDFANFERLKNPGFS